MTKIELLRVYLNQRLVAAAEEIFGVVEKTIVEFQEEVSRTKEENSRLRSMLDIVIKPEIRLHRIDLELPTIPLPEEQDPFEPEHCDLEWSPSQWQVDPQPTWIKSEPNEPESSLKNAYKHQDSTLFSLYETEMDDCVENYCLPSTSTQKSNCPSPSSSCQQSTFQIKTESDVDDNEESEHTSESEPLSATSRPTVSSTGHSENNEIVNGTESRSHSDSKPLKSKRSQSKRLQTVRKQSIYIRCKFCGMYFSYVASLVNHARKHAQDNECLCGVCGIHSESTEHMLDHLESHVGARVCHVCGKFFSGNTELNDHMKIHPGEKSFRCPDCGKCFRKNPDLTAHKRVHTGERPYRCQFCGKGFTQSGNLAVHMKSHSGEKPHCCPLCGKRFSSKSYMTTHMKIHSGERPFCCRVCGKRFIRNPDLTVHMRVHTGVKPYLCKCCGQAFTQSYHLKLHMNIHLRETKSLPS